MAEDKNKTASKNEEERKPNKTKINTISSRKSKISLFDIINYLVFIILALVIMVPIWKVLVDSLTTLYFKLTARL